ncbi:MAG TPA: hypothetical protein VF658_01310 [Pyrinomonadaceae bacterium]
MQKRHDFQETKVRAHQQHEAHLLFTVQVEDENAHDESRQQPVTLTGYTQGVGSDSLSLIGPFYHFGYRYLMGRDRTLQVVLHLPNGTINIQGFPVRYTKMSDDKQGDGYMLTGPNVASFGETDVNCLIEVSVVVMSDSDRATFEQYLGQFNLIEAENVVVLPSFMEAPPRPSKASSWKPSQPLSSPAEILQPSFS